MIRSLLGVLCLLLAGPASGQAPGQDPLRRQVEEVLEQARREIREFEKAGGPRQDDKHPVARWVERLWAFRDSHPRTPAAGHASAEAIHLLVHADRAAEAQARADGLPADDPAWETLGPILLEAASASKNYEVVVRKLGSVVEERRDPDVRERLRHQLGVALSKAGEREAARAAFAAVLRERPGSPLAKEAETALYELDNLGYGQPAPPFTGKARNGPTVSLADLGGRVVLLVFWAST